MRGEPLLSVGFLDNQFAFLNAGLSYVALIVSVQVTSHRHGEPVDGAYTLVEWHNRPDNMMTAREEIAYPSLWAVTKYLVLVLRRGRWEPPSCRGGDGLATAQCDPSRTWRGSSILRRLAGFVGAAQSGSRTILPRHS